MFRHEINVVGSEGDNTQSLGSLHYNVLKDHKGTTLFLPNWKRWHYGYSK